MPFNTKSRPQKSARNIVFVTFESAFAPAGGLTAVMRALPQQTALLEQGRCFLMAPFFRSIARRREELFHQIQPTGVFAETPFGGRLRKTAIYVHTAENGFQSFLLHAPDFFQAPCDSDLPPGPDNPCNPYLNPADPGALLRDALFFCAAVPKALVALGRTENLVFNLQDWQAASVALTVREEPAITSAASIVTLHNPYDAWVDDAAMRSIISEDVWNYSILTKAIPFTDGPVCTVSENFGRELTEDPLQTGIYAHHLQDLFRRKGVVGINNGRFQEPDFPRAALEAAADGDFEPIVREKEAQRKQLIRTLEEYTPDEAWGELDLSGFDGPIFLFFGRDDPRQKGYDVAAAAIRRLERGKARYVFTPIPGDEGPAGLGFLKELATGVGKGEVKVFPFMIPQELYRSLQRGSSYIVMCSFYEPFGGGIEGFAVGTPVVARATGGLVQQVAPYPSRSISASVRNLAARFHGPKADPTGFLFREPSLPGSDEAAEWAAITDCGYRYQVPMADRVASRMQIRLFRAMVQETAWAMQDAADLYIDDRIEYAKLIRNGFDMLETFRWDRTVREYQRVYDLVCEE